ncbi:MAG: regulatory protein TetR, partial [Actinomycetia bacterium]|nr:regulatory protein TetR [Actinomycetes bacterium]
MHPCPDKIRPGKSARGLSEEHAGCTVQAVSEIPWACPPGACTPPTEGRQRLLEAAGPLLATRGLDVPDRVIIAAAGHRNKSAIAYHFGSRAGLIHAIW